MIATIPEMIEKIDKPKVKELVLAYWEAMGPMLTKTEDDIIKNMGMYGAPNSVEEEAIRGLIRQESVRAILMSIQERIAKEIAKREATGEKP